MSKKKSKFHFRLNGGEEQIIKVKSGLYVEAAAAIPAVFGVDGEAYPLTIEIWVPDLLPEYGPYTYYIHEPGGEVGHRMTRWDGETIISYSCRRS